MRHHAFVDHYHFDSFIMEITHSILWVGNKNVWHCSTVPYCLCLCQGQHNMTGYSCYKYYSPIYVSDRIFGQWYIYQMCLSVSFFQYVALHFSIKLMIYGFHVNILGHTYRQLFIVSLNLMINKTRKCWRKAILQCLHPNV